MTRQVRVSNFRGSIPITIIVVVAIVRATCLVLPDPARTRLRFIGLFIPCLHSRIIVTDCTNVHENFLQICGKILS